MRPIRCESADFGSDIFLWVHMILVTFLTRTRARELCLSYAFTWHENNALRCGAARSTNEEIETATVVHTALSTETHHRNGWILNEAIPFIYSYNFFVSRWIRFLIFLNFVPTAHKWFMRVFCLFRFSTFNKWRNDVRSDKKKQNKNLHIVQFHMRRLWPSIEYSKSMHNRSHWAYIHQFHTQIDCAMRCKR